MPASITASRQRSPRLWRWPVKRSPASLDNTFGAVTPQLNPPRAPPRSRPNLAERLRAYAWQHLMQRFLTLNERTKRYGRGYSKPVLRGAAIVLHWFIQAALRQGERRVASLRGLAQETGLTFRSAKQARARLIAWGLLAEQNGAWVLDYMRLAQLLFEEGAELPSAPAVDRRRGRHHDH